MNEDRRTRRTRQLLRNAFLGLLREKRYDDISVQDIIERADVARSTFYAHYVDKEDLLVGKRGVFSREARGHAELPQAKNKGHLIPPTCFWYNILAQRDIFKIIARDSAMDVTMKDLHNKLCANIHAEIQQQRPERGVVPASLIVDYLATSIITLIKWWVKQGMTYSPEQMDKIFHEMAMPVVGLKAPSHF
jgi:hypothetical protein